MTSQEHDMRHDLQPPSSTSDVPRWILAHSHQVPPDGWSLTWSREGWGLRKRQRVSALKVEARKVNPKLEPQSLGPNAAGGPAMGQRAQNQKWAKQRGRRGGMDSTGVGHASLASCTKSTDPPPKVPETWLMIPALGPRLGELGQST